MKPGFVLAVVAAAVVIGCSGAAGSPAAGAPTSQPTARLTPAPAQVAAADPSAACPVTKPDPAFVPPPRFRATPSPARQAWYGSAELFTALDKDGERWHALPRSSDGSLGQKTFWWSESFSVATEQQPAILVEGRRLDRVGPTFHAGDPGTNASFDGMSSMLVGVEVPTSGCWELTALYRGAQLGYVVWVAND
jgi:hypothetical protein